MQRRHFFVRNIHVGNFLETFLVASISVLLATRFYLAAAGYPQIGGRGLHIAHMLWGGLLMLIAIVLLLAFLGRRIQFTSAILGGAGFGLFIDELGKFITNDNNYFFQPTIAIIYIIFVLMLLVFRFLERHTYPSEQARLANALDILKEGVLRNMHGSDKAEALVLLRAGSEHLPVYLLVDAVESMPVVQPAQSGLLKRISEGARRFYVRLNQLPYFPTLLITLFSLYALILTLFLALDMLAIAISPTEKATVSQIGLFGSTLLSDAMIVIGIFFLLRKESTKALLWFKRAALVALFLAQIFLFYRQQLGAVGELAINLVILGMLNFLLYNRRHDLRHESPIQQVAATQTAKSS